MNARRVPARRGGLPTLRNAEAGLRRARHPFHRLLPALALAALALASVWVPIARAQDSSAQESSAGPPIPVAVGFVNDHAGKLDETTRARLEAFLDQVKQKTGAEFAVLIMPSTAPVSPTEYKVSVFKQWGLGKKGEDNGLLMLVAIEEHQVRFETGYGLEGALPDGLQSRIFRERMAPQFRAGDYAAGVTEGVLACAARIAAEKGVTLEWNGKELRYGTGRKRAFPLSLLVWVLIIIFFIVMRSIGGGGGYGRRRGGWYIGPGGFGGGSFGGLGGGGGGGGGGFGGGSFGGFGGGASGGGGGGGSW